MVMHRSEVPETPAGHHGGLRRGTAVVALGAVLALTAGVPATQAATPTPRPDGPSASISVGIDDLIGGLVDSPDASPSPTSGSASPEPTESTAPPTSTAPDPTETPEQRASRQASEPATPGTTAPGTSLPQPVPAAPQPVTGQPTGTQQAPAPVQPPAADTPAAASGTAAGATAGKPTASPSGTPRSATTMSAAKEASPTATPRSGDKMQAASSVQPSGPSALVGWGICLVAVSLGAGAVVLRMRRV